VKKLSLIFMAAALLSGCTMPGEPSDATKKMRGEARIPLFRECMELAAKMPRQADDDVSDIVQECGSQAYYMTNYLEVKP
jgi:hypothetical protein